jgi:hypothetical protein
MKVGVVTKFYEILRRTTKQFQYADDIALILQNDSFSEWVFSLMATITEPYYDWNLCFTSQVQHVDHSKYLVNTLDRSVTYNTHLTKSAKKVAARVKLVRKLTRIIWRASSDTIRTKNPIFPKNNIRKKSDFSIAR